MVVKTPFRSQLLFFRQHSNVMVHKLRGQLFVTGAENTSLKVRPLRDSLKCWQVSVTMVLWEECFLILIREETSAAWCLIILDSLAEKPLPRCLSVTWHSYYWLQGELNLWYIKLSSTYKCNFQSSSFPRTRLVLWNTAKTNAFHSCSCTANSQGLLCCMSMLVRG